MGRQLAGSVFLVDWRNKLVLKALQNAAIVIEVFPEKGDGLGKGLCVGFNHLCTVRCRVTGVDSLNDILFVEVERVESG